MTCIAFIGGGNMASAIIKGLLQSGHLAHKILVVEPLAAQRDKLHTEWGVQTFEAADAALSQAQWVVWAVKPQSFAQAASECRALTAQALHLSIMAGINIDSLSRLICSDLVVRGMPNTPALIGLGITGLYAKASVNADQRRQVDAVLSGTGRTLWFDKEADINTVTAISGSGPAYVFYMLEAMIQAGVDLGLTAEQAKQLSLNTFAGATALAQTSLDSPATLREKVTSKGGTTDAALQVLNAHHVDAHLIDAIYAAQQRATELGNVS